MWTRQTRHGHCARASHAATASQRRLGAAAKHGAARRDGDADEGMEQLRAPVAAEPDPEAQDTDSGKRPRGKGVLAAAEARRAVVQAAVPHVA